jgi:hypothetical protein
MIRLLIVWKEFTDFCLHPSHPTPTPTNPPPPVYPKSMVSPEEMSNTSDSQTSISGTASSGWNPISERFSVRFDSFGRQDVQRSAGLSSLIV